MKKKYALLFIGTLLLPINTLATSGALTGSSIVSCNGQNYGSHGDGHWHIAERRDNRWYAVGEPLSGNPCANNSYVPPTNQNNYNKNNNSQNNQNYVTTAKEEPVIAKSSDTSLKEIKINGESIDLNNPSYETDKDNIEIEVMANDTNATLIYEKNIKLSNGSNKATISITAENGDKKEYEININKTVKSNNKEFKIFYNDEKLNVNVSNKTIEDLIVFNFTKNLKLTYSTTDKNTKIKISGNKNLKVGENVVKLTITSEDGSSETYSMRVSRMSILGTVISYIFSIVFLGAIIILPIRLIKKRKSARTK